MQTVLTDSLSWSALDFSTDPPSYRFVGRKSDLQKVLIRFVIRTFKVEFPSPDMAAEFRDMFAEGKELAEQSEILETVGDQVLDGNTI
jgi:hypothetical protein